MKGNKIKVDWSKEDDCYVATIAKGKYVLFDGQGVNMVCDPGEVVQGPHKIRR